MFTISVKTSFRASHQLALPGGPKEQLHEHDWSVTAKVGSEKLDKMGIVMDFSCLTSEVDSIVSELDNKTLERIEYFRQHNSSAENVAKYIYEKLEPRVPREVKLLSISVVEEPGRTAKFSRD